MWIDFELAFMGLTAKCLHLSWRHPHPLEQLAQELGFGPGHSIPLLGEQSPLNVRVYDLWCVSCYSMGFTPWEVHIGFRFTNRQWRCPVSLVAPVSLVVPVSKCVERVEINDTLW